MSRVRRDKVVIDTPRIGSIFLSSLAPRYIRSLWIGFGITLAGLLAVIFNVSAGRSETVIGLMGRLSCTGR